MRFSRYCNWYRLETPQRECQQPAWDIQPATTYLLPSSFVVSLVYRKFGSFFANGNPAMLYNIARCKKLASCFFKSKSLRLLLIIALFLYSSWSWRLNRPSHADMDTSKSLLTLTKVRKGRHVSFEHKNWVQDINQNLAFHPRYQCKPLPDLEGPRDWYAASTHLLSLLEVQSSGFNKRFSCGNQTPG